MGSEFRVALLANTQLSDLFSTKEFLSSGGMLSDNLALSFCKMTKGHLFTRSRNTF